MELTKNKKRMIRINPTGTNLQDIQHLKKAGRQVRGAERQSI